MCNLIKISLLLIIIVGCEGTKYPVGKDTVQSFGTGMYQIMKSSDQTLSMKNLDDEAVLTLIEEKIYRYKLVDDKIYIYGDLGYSILEFKSSKLKQFINFQGYDKEMLEQYHTYFEPNNQKYYGTDWVRLNSFDEFTEKEKEIFQSLKTNENSK